MHKHLQKLRKEYLIPLLVIFFTTTSNIYGQQVSGTITDSGTGETLPGVNIIVQGTTTGTTSDMDGNYELNVSSLSDTLVFSFVGYVTQTIPIDGRTTIDVSMSQQLVSGEELVVVGYGTQRREDVTGAVGSVSSENLDNVSTSNSASLLQGRVSGVRVTSGGGAPDAEATVVIRGTGTFGNDQPLYVIDGMITNSMSFLNPKDIESIEVLKDASTAAIYGNRAANGVVIITTKNGVKGQDTQINFSSSVGIQSPTSKYDFLNASQYAQHNNAFHDNDGLPRAPAYSDANFDPSVNTDWQDVQLNDPFDATVVRNSLSLSGGSENSSYYVSGEHLNQLGLVKQADFRRFGLRVNSNFTFDKFTIDQSFSANREINHPNSYFGRERGALPVIPVYNDENLGGFAGVRPSYHGVARGINWYGVAVLNDHEITTDNIVGNMTTTYEIIEGLEYKLNLGLDYGMNQNVNYMPAFFQSRSQEAFNDEADLGEYSTRAIGLLVENTLNYTVSLGNHNVDLLAGYTQETNRIRTVGASVTSFPNNDLRTVDAATEVVDASGQLLKSVLKSGFGRINYNYKNKYLISGTLRADGSSKFAEGNRWGTFPSGSIGWRISEEPFIPDFFNELKVRASYGELGSQNIAQYATITGLNIDASYFFAGGVQQGTALTSFTNPDIIWETSKTFDVGIDVAFMEDKFSFTADYFDKRSEGVLVQVPIPVYGGVGSSVLTNAANIKNHGVEFSGTYHQQSSSGFNYSITGDLSFIRNEVLALGEGVNPISGGNFTQQGFQATRTAPGHPIGSFYGYVVDGIYQSQEEIDADGRSEARPGDFKFKDLNGDGQLTDEDRTYLGTYQPDFEYGVNFSGSYERFDVSLFIQGVQGNELWNAKKFQYILDNAGGNKITDVMNSWTPDNTDTDIPRATFSDPANNKRASSFFVENGSYLRVKSLQIGYRLPSNVIQKVSSIANLSSVKIYARAQNLLTITNYSGYDPEVGRNSGFRNTGLFGQGVDTNAQPQPETYTLGIDISF